MCQLNQVLQECVVAIKRLYDSHAYIHGATVSYNTCISTRETKKPGYIIRMLEATGLCLDLITALY